MSAYAAAIGQTADAARAALPAPDPEAGARLLAGATRLERSRTLIRDLPEELRPGLGRLLHQARGFDRTAPPNRGTLRGYSQVLASGAAATAAFLDQAGGPETATAAAAWRAAAEPWARLHQKQLPRMATLGRRNPAVEHTANDTATRLDRLRQLPHPAPASQRDRLLADAAALGAALRELSGRQRDLIRILTHAGELYQPTRLLGETDTTAAERRAGPRRWHPLPPDAAAAVTAAYTTAAARVTEAAALTADTAGGPPRRQQPVALTGLERLARSQARTAAVVPTPAAEPHPRVRP